MKLKIFHLSVIFLSGFVLLTSCKTHTITGETGEVKGPVVIQKPTVADLDVKDTKVEGSSTLKGIGKSVSQAKELAIADALTKSNADVLVNPQFDIKTSFMKVEVKVTGYPATYKNFRPMEPGDTLFVSADNIHPQKRMFNAQKGSNLKKALGITGGALALGAGVFFFTVWFL